MRTAAKGVVVFAAALAWSCSDPEGSGPERGGDAALTAEPDANPPDAGVRETGAKEAGPRETGAPEVGTQDAGPNETGLPDAGAPDTGVPEASLPEASLPEAARPEASLPEASLPEAALPEASLPEASPPEASPPDVHVDPECGNGVVEPGEECDGTTDCRRSCTFVPTAFQLTDLAVLDPPLHYGCEPITDLTNGLIDTLFVSDTGDLAGTRDDGIFDLSFALVFYPRRTEGAGHRGEFLEASCGASTPPLLPSPSCTIAPSLGPNAFVYEHLSSDTCLAAREGTTHPGATNPVPTLLGGTSGCFLGNEQASVLVDIGTIEVPMRFTRLAGRWSADGTRIEEGRMVGFVTHEQAARVRIVPLETGSVMLSDLLVRDGGRGCGDAGVLPSDEDTAPDGSRGFWFYYSFTAERVTWTEGL